MERGLIWLPLLAFFIWLAWSGWNEYQKLEAYRVWAVTFERAKYDIYAVLGQKGDELTWGKPTRQGPIDLQTVSLAEVRSLRFWVNQQPADWDQPPTKGRAVLELQQADGGVLARIPFTDPALAAQWGLYLRKAIQR